jgi:hypothetical protein
LKTKLIALIAASTFVLGIGTAYAIGTLNLTVPLMPVVGQDTAAACDTDGATVALAYGQTRSTGIKINSATVSGVATACTTGQVEFIATDGTVAHAATGTVTSGSFTASTNVWTDQFDTIRVVLLP